MASLKKCLDRWRNPWKGDFYDAFKAWKRENGPAKLYDYADLLAGSVIWDVGGFKGEWTDIILAAQPDVTVHIFEPHPEFARALQDKFAGDARIIVHELALGAADGELELSDAGDASSTRADHGKSFTARVQSVEGFLKEHPTPKIDLMKMNIEGGEYSLLPALMDAKLIQKIKRLQVQFHLFEEAMKPLRDPIRESLSKTHDCVWYYPFVWEEWQLKR